jgi:zinc transporter ZupT
VTTRTDAELEARADEPRGGVPGWILGLFPLVLLGLVVALFLVSDPLSGLREGFPPVEELTFTHVELDTGPKQIVVTVRNGGPDPVTIAQVLVDDAYWDHAIEPAREIPRLGSATIAVPYPWVDGETHELVLISSSGITFDHEIGVAVETPAVTGRVLALFTLIGVFVGVVPVFLGLLWFPFVRRLRAEWVHFLLALTAGLLVFLAVDALDEAFEIAGDVPGAFQGVGLITLGVALALAALYGLDGWLRRRRGGEVSPLFVAFLIAAGIGLHNLGEGLAIGAAYALGEVGLTAFLVLGFMLHNVTEGLGIVSPLARTRAHLGHLALLGVVAGAPTVVGTWTGGLAFSPTLAVLFLSIGAGAIVQVVWEIGRLMRRETKTLATPRNAVGFALGLLVMYATGLAVAL